MALHPEREAPLHTMDGRLGQTDSTAANPELGDSNDAVGQDTRLAFAV